MPEQWSAPPREAYEHNPHLQSVEALQSQENQLRENLRRYSEAHNSEAHRDKARLGAIAGKNFIRLYQITGELQAHGPETARKLYKRFEQDQQQILSALGEEEGSQFISGFINEFAIAHLLTHPKILGAKVYFPSESQERYEEGMGIDWWVDLSEDYPDNPSTALALQVKSIPYRSERMPPHKLVYPLRDYQDLQVVYDRVLTPDNLRPRVEIDKLHRRVQRSAEKLLDVPRHYENAAAGLVLLPSVFSEASFINPTTGRLAYSQGETQTIPDILWNDISELSSLDKIPEMPYNRLAA